MTEYRVITTEQVVDARGLKKAFPQTAINFNDVSSLAELVFATPKPDASTNLHIVIRDGVTKDGNGNWVQSWKEQDMFSDNEESTKEEQEVIYLAKLAEAEVVEKNKLVVDEIDKLIQNEIDTYNLGNGVAFVDINSLSKYALVPTYTHYDFCISTITWVASVWETLRQIQVDVVTKVRTEPTLEELLNELPVRAV